MLLAEAMRGTFFYYAEANLVCLLIFVFILVKNLTNVDRQERQRCFDRVLILHILYFAFDSLWMYLHSGARCSDDYVLSGLIDVILFTIAAFGACNWYIYLEIMLGSDFIKGRRARLLCSVPAILTSLLAVLGFVRDFDYWDGSGKGLHTTWYYALMISIPFLYVMLAVVRAFYKACRKEAAARRHVYVSAGIYPLAIALTSVLQVFFLDVPILCYGCTLAMIYVYVNSLDNLISLDPLTQLNNRNELRRFLLNMQHHPEIGVYLLMIDVDKFKGINDRYGHLAGDKALRCIADSLRESCASCSKRHFIARYGGDEFIIAAIADREEEVKELCSLIRGTITAKNKESGAEFDLTVSIGYARLGSEEDALHHCLSAADAELYKIKRARE